MAEKRRNKARKGKIPQRFEYLNGTKSKHSTINRNIYSFLALFENAQNENRLTSVSTVRPMIRHSQE
jgi:hypothetical protein